MQKFLELSKKTREWGQKKLFNILNSLNFLYRTKITAPARRMFRYRP